MATVNGVITGGAYDGQAVKITIPSVRIPELPEVVLPLELADSIAVFDESEQRTSKQPLSAIRALMITGGAGAGTPPVAIGGRYEIIVDEANIDGTKRVLVPELINKEFTLTRTGYGELIASDFLVLPSGGFELVEDEVRLGEVYIAKVYSAGTSTPGPTDPAQSIVNGIAVIVDDTPLTSVHRYKMLHIASPTKNCVVTLEDISVVPPNLIIPIETTLAGVYKTKLQTQAGQYIYIAGESKTSVWLGANEFIWLLRGTDGYYILKASDSLTKVGQPFFDYVSRFNSVIANGALILRKAEPRLWEWVLANGGTYVSEADWQSTPLNRGKFSTGTITTGDAANFRLPDFQNQAFRALNNIGGADTQRPGNTVGLLQGDAIGTHDIDIPLYENGTGSDTRTPYRAAITDNNTVFKGTGKLTYTGPETRIKNVGLLPLINT